MSNAEQRAEEVRALLSQQEDLDPHFVSRVLKLCRMHEAIDEVNEEERRSLRVEKEKATKAYKRNRADYERLITRVHNQRVEIKRLQRRLDEREAS